VGSSPTEGFRLQRTARKRAVFVAVKGTVDHLRRKEGVAVGVNRLRRRKWLESESLEVRIGREEDRPMLGTGFGDTLMT
jgi:hypothetical protein